jgi:dTDP-3,4-didehydro-2,6-dideoxy-alpha-D-glucose 3-reductase
VTLRLAVLGCGRAAALAIGRAWRDAPEVRITAIASRDPARARAFAAAHGLSAARIVATGDDLLHEDVDAVYIGLPDEQHETWALRALAAGKSVLVEKPLALDAAAGARIATAADAAGLAVLEGLMLQHHPWAGRVAARCAALADVRALRTILHFSIPADRRGHRVLEDLAPYWLWLVGLSAPLDLSSVTASSSDGEIEVKMNVGERVTAVLHASHARSYKATHVVEYATGTLVLPDLFRANLGPQRLAIEESGTREWVEGRSAFSHQLSAFAALCKATASDRGDVLSASLARLRAVDRIRAAWTHLANAVTMPR